MCILLHATLPPDGVVERLMGTFKSMPLKHVNFTLVMMTSRCTGCRARNDSCVVSVLSTFAFSFGMSPFKFGMVFGRQRVPVLPKTRLLLDAVHDGGSLTPDLSLEEAECQAPFDYAH